MMPMMIRQFELRSVIGSGGMGTVYRAWDTTLERMVAVKLMRRNCSTMRRPWKIFIAKPAPVPGSTIRTSFTFTPLDEWEGQQYLVMELADHGSLDARIEKLRLLQELDMLDIGIKIASALDLALSTICSTGTSSRGNILFNADHEPKTD